MKKAKMQIRIVKESNDFLKYYSKVPISFTVDSILKVNPITNGINGFEIEEISVSPWVKDYDAIEAPISWKSHWDLSQWGIYSAYHDDNRIGGIIIAFNTEGVWKLEGRKDIAVIWDIRIKPEYRRVGVGKQLVKKAIEFSRKRNCKYLKVETQNVNVPACNFYKNCGFTLGSINLYAYHEYPEEVEMIWYKRLKLKLRNKEKEIKT